MLPILGSIIVLASVLSGYAGMGGNVLALWQPFEIIIIVGASIGAYILSNPGNVLHDTAGAIRDMMRKRNHGRDSYLELLSLLFVVFRNARTKGWMSLERHIERPRKSDLFRQFPHFYLNASAVTFLTDYLRIISLGSSNPYELNALMDEEIETIHSERLRVSYALQTMGDSLPALGIIGAVLGVIRAMGSISEPPAVLGHLIAGALVGTFTGIWLSYGFIQPIAAAMRARVDSEMKYYLCMKAGLLAYLQGAAPQIAIEFARKVLLTEDRPTFIEVEDATLAIPSKVA